MKVDDSVTKDGTIIYRVGASIVRDKGKVFEISQAFSKEELKAAIKMAKQRFGNSIKVNGSELFQRAIVQTAAYFKINVSFDDPRLEKLHQELIIHSTGKVKSNEQTRQPQFNNRATIGRNNEVSGTRIHAVNFAIGGGRAGNRYFKRINKPDLGLIGRSPPPESKNGLRNLSQLSVVQFTRGSEMLLPVDVHDKLEQQRAKFDNSVRREISGKLNRAGQKVRKANKQSQI